jgi:hypothetical protein
MPHVVPPPQCAVGQNLIEGACFAQCPQYYTEATYLSPSACVSNVECPAGFSSGGDFTICQKPTLSRTVVNPDGTTGDCATGFTFWDNTCSSVCPDGYSIFDGTTCTEDCPSGFLENSQNCFKPVTIRDPLPSTCPTHYVASDENICVSTLPPFNSKLLWLVIGIGIITLFLILFLTKDITFNFESKSKPVPITFNDELVPQPNSIESEIPTRFLIDQLKTHRKIPTSTTKPTNSTNTIKEQYLQTQTQTNNFPESPSSGSEHSSMSSGSGSQNSSVDENWMQRQSFFYRNH